MRILLALAIAIAFMAGLAVILSIVGLQLSRAVAGGLSGPLARTSMLSKIVFALLWLLIAGVATGFIGGA